MRSRLQFSFFNNPCSLLKTNNKSLINKQKNLIIVNFLHDLRIDNLMKTFLAAYMGKA